MAAAEPVAAHPVSSRWFGTERTSEDYDRRFAEREQAGHDVHGEARFVETLGVRSVLDAGCGTGRIAIELARRGLKVVGVDVDPDMLAVARRKAPELRWHLADLAELHLTGDGGGSTLFDAAVMAGNVMIFVEPGSEGRVVETLARHLAPGGLLVAGFQLMAGRLDLATYDHLAGRVGLELRERWATWDRAPWQEGGDYAVSVHRSPGGPGSSTMKSMSELSERMS